MLLFSHRDVSKILEMKNFLCLKVAEFDMGVNFECRRTVLDIKTHLFTVKPIFRGK